MYFPYGELKSELPPEFFPLEMWPEYGYITDPVTLCKREIISTNPIGMRWGIWPLFFEVYWGDTEPDIRKSSAGNLAYNRIAVWRPMHRTDKPRGWHRGTKKLFRIDGFQALDPQEDFTRRWNRNARRELRTWQECHLNKTHTLEKISFEEYDESYKKSLVAKKAGFDRLVDLRRKFPLPIVQKHCALWGVRSISTGKIVAGTAIIFSPTYKSSSHFAPFILEEARHISAATGLIYHWFEESRKNKTPHVITLNFWYPGKPKDWKGFSEFKSHFGFEYVTYPPTLWRLVRGKFF